MTVVADLVATFALKPDKGSFGEGSKLLGGIKNAIAAFVAVETVRKIGQTISATIDLGGHLDDLRQKTGLSAESLQAYGFAAKLGGSSMDGFAHGITKLARTLEAAKTGSKESSKALTEVGLTSEDTTKALGSQAGLDATLLKIADKFKSMPDGAKKSALAMQLFGKSGVELIPTLNQGGAGLAQLKQEAIDLGAVMSEDAVTAADALGDNIDKLKMSVTGLKNQAIVALLPFLKETVDATLAWIKANKTEIVEDMTMAVHGLIAVMKGIGFVIFDVIQPAFNWFADHMDVTMAILIALGVVIADFALAAAVSWVIAFAPILLIIAAIAAIVYGIRWLIRNWDVVREKFRSVAQTIHDTFDSILSSADELKDRAVKGLLDAGHMIMVFFTDTVPTAVRHGWEDLVNWVQQKSIDLLKIVQDNKLLGFLTSATGMSGVIHSDLTEQAQRGLDLKKQAQQVERTGVGQASPSVPGTATVTTGVFGPGITIQQSNNVTLNANGVNDPKALAAAAAAPLTQHLRDAKDNL